MRNPFCLQYSQLSHHAKLLLCSRAAVQVCTELWNITDPKGTLQDSAVSAFICTHKNQCPIEERVPRTLDKITPGNWSNFAFFKTLIKQINPGAYESSGNDEIHEMPSRQIRHHMSLCIFRFFSKKFSFNEISLFWPQLLLSGPTAPGIPKVFSSLSW